MSKRNEMATLYQTVSQPSTDTLTHRLGVNDNFQRA